MGISFQELILLLLIGLIVLGPERLPRVANQLGSWLGQARRMTRVMKRQLEEELNLDKQFDMLPPARTRHSAPGTYKPPVTPAADAATAATDLSAPADAAGGEPEKDDTYSPAHGRDEIGTGVGDDDDAAADEAAGVAEVRADEQSAAGKPEQSTDDAADDKKESA